MSKITVESNDSGKVYIHINRLRTIRMATPQRTRFGLAPASVDETVSSHLPVLDGTS